MTTGNANDELLSRIQEVLMMTDLKPGQLGSALQWDYLFGKNSENNPRVLSAMAMLMDEKKMFLIMHFCLPNRSRTILLQEERSLLDATHRKWPDVMAESMKLKASLGKWEDKMFLMKFNPNAGGYLCLLRNLSQIARVVEHSIRDCALHRQLCIIVALRRYELRHGGLPGKLNNLCPEYLPAIPNDPLDGVPMRSDLAAGKIYSIGIDMKDDRGSFGPLVHSGEKVRDDKDIGRFYWWLKPATSP